ncbi:MAG: ribosome silencing factor [Clostridia bacterium]|nr:ribosome silencing factor [Clostridia bacterium]MDQ7791638.1 ribosome silencing factor [Clostridia bacterium]
MRLITVDAILQRAVQAAESVKGYDPVVLDIRKLTVVSDYFLIVTGRSTTHVKAIADHIVEELEDEGVFPLRREGQKEGRWVLLDYNHLVIHIFLDEERVFYNLERLWGDAPVVNIRASI